MMGAWAFVRQIFRHAYGHSLHKKSLCSVENVSPPSSPTAPFPSCPHNLAHFLQLINRQRMTLLTGSCRIFFSAVYSNQRQMPTPLSKIKVGKLVAAYGWLEQAVALTSRIPLGRSKSVLSHSSA